MNALSNGRDETLLRLVVIWRRDTSHIKYEWMSGVSLYIERLNNETDEYNYNVTKRKLGESIQRLLRASESLSYEAEVKVKTEALLFLLFLLILKTSSLNIETFLLIFRI